jgi:multidrug resistance efflux pump
VAGEVLAVLEKERANAGVDESRARVAALAAALTRARAEAQSIAPVFSSESRKYPEVVGEQLALYRQSDWGWRRIWPRCKKLLAQHAKSCN